MLDSRPPNHVKLTEGTTREGKSSPLWPFSREKKSIWKEKGVFTGTKAEIKGEKTHSPFRAKCLKIKGKTINSKSF